MKRCPHCGKSAAQADKKGPLVSHALWALVAGDGPDEIITRQGKAIRGRAMSLQEAPIMAQLGRLVHKCNGDKNDTRQ